MYGFGQVSETVEVAEGCPVRCRYGPPVALDAGGRLANGKVEGHMRACVPVPSVRYSGTAGRMARSPRIARIAHLSGMCAGKPAAQTEPLTP